MASERGEWDAFRPVESRSRLEKTYRPVGDEIVELDALPGVASRAASAISPGNLSQSVS